MYGMSYERSYPNDLVSQYTVVFSPYGTYLLSIDYSDGQKETINRVWRWKDSEESMICYGIESSECNDNNQTTIVSLTETNLTLKTVMAASETETNDILEIF